MTTTSETVHEALCPGCYYGVAPHTHDIEAAGGIIGSTRLLPRDQWPPNFEPDGEDGTSGVYHCPVCCNCSRATPDTTSETVDREALRKALDAIDAAPRPHSVPASAVNGYRISANDPRVPWEVQRDVSMYVTALVDGADQLVTAARAYLAHPPAPAASIKVEAVTCHRCGQVRLSIDGTLTKAHPCKVGWDVLATAEVPVPAPAASDDACAVLMGLVRDEAISESRAAEIVGIGIVEFRERAAHALLDTKPEQRRLADLYRWGILPNLRRVAHEHGYALGTHGSEARDFDLIAAPWAEDAKAPAYLARALRLEVDGYFQANEELPRVKPHGRLCWPIYFTPWPGHELVYIDLSVLPIAPAPIAPREEQAGEYPTGAQYSHGPDGRLHEEWPAREEQAGGAGEERRDHFRSACQSAELAGALDLSIADGWPSEDWPMPTYRELRALLAPQPAAKEATEILRRAAERYSEQARRQDGSKQAREEQSAAHAKLLEAAFAVWPAAKGGGG